VWRRELDSRGIRLELDITCELDTICMSQHVFKIKPVLFRKMLRSGGDMNGLM
jgi:hypothetical protein